MTILSEMCFNARTVLCFVILGVLPHLCPWQRRGHTTAKQIVDLSQYVQPPEEETSPDTNIKSGPSLRLNNRVQR